LIYRVDSSGDEPICIMDVTPVQVAMERLVSCVDAGPMVIRAAIKNLENVLLEYPQTEQPLEHFFAKGLYGRKIFNPAGSVIVTALHKEQNLSSILKGTLLVITENGTEILEAPKFFVTNPGTKRVLYAVEDVIFTTVHPNPLGLRDTDELERRIIAESFDEIEIEGVRI